MRGSSIRIFLVDGTPTGLKVAEISNWTGKAIVSGRALLPQLKKREEAQKPGVYILTGPDREHPGETIIYIGEGDPIWPRIENHSRAKEFWTQVVMFVSKDENLNKAHVQYLEARLIEDAHRIANCKLDNNTVPDKPSLPEADIADMETFLERARLLLPLLGVHAFEPTESRSSATGDEMSVVFQTRAKGLTARGYETGDGFVVLKGSQVAKEEVPTVPKSAKLKRAKLLEEGILIDRGKFFELVRDMEFQSPSGASDVVLGRSSNGRIEWKTKDGKTLAEIQETRLSKVKTK